MNIKILLKEDISDEDVIKNLRKGGIYKITNLVNEKVYIGSSHDLKRRKEEHYSRLKSNKHNNKYLQNAYNKYDPNNFEFCVLEIVEDNSRLIEREQYWIDKYQSYNKNKGYNLRPIAESNKGYKHSEEAKKKISESNIGKKHTEETKQHLSLINIGKKLSKEQKQKISRNSRKIWLGKNLSETHKKHLRKPKSVDGFQKGENNTLSKLTEEQVKEIKLLLNNGLEHQKIAILYNVCAATITSIKNGKNWSHVKVDGINDEELKKQRHPRYGSKLDEEKVKEIKKLLKEGIKGSLIAEMFNVAKVTIYDIKSGKTWKNVII